MGRPRMIAGRPSSTVRLVTLLTSALVMISCGGVSPRATMKTKSRLPGPGHSGMTRVPSAVPGEAAVHDRFQPPEHERRGREKEQRVNDGIVEAEIGEPGGKRVHARTRR